MAAVSFIRTTDPAAEGRDLDFGAVYRGARAVSRGDSPYIVDQFGPLGTYVYGPAWAYLLQPLAKLDYVWARRIWMAINWAIAIGCVAMALRLAFGRATVSALALWLALLPVASYFWSSLRAGQFGLFMVALLIGWAFCRRICWRFSGGVLLAAAISVKLAPGIFVPYLLIRRDWRGLAGVAVGGLALVFVPAIWVGWSGALHLHRDWAEHCRDTQVAVQALRPENQAILGQLTRLPHISNGYVLFDAPAFDAMNRVYPMIVLTLIAALYAMLAWRRFRLENSYEVESQNRDIAILIAAMLLLHPRAWTYNFVALVLPCAMLARHVVARSTRRWPALAVLALLALVCALPKPAAAPDWTFLRWLHQGKDCWAALMVAAVCAWPPGRGAVPIAESQPKFAKAA